MKKLVRKIIIVFASSIMIIVSVPSLVMADYFPTNEKYEYYHDEIPAPTTRKEITEYVYREYNGRIQRRLWSRTRGIWIESNWSYI